MHHDGNRNSYQCGGGRNIGRWHCPDTVPDSYRKDRRLGIAAKAEAAKKAFVGETYVRIRDRWRHLQRTVDQDVHVIDIPVQPRRDRKAALRFFRKPNVDQRGDPTGISPQQSRYTVIRLRGERGR